MKRITLICCLLVLAGSLQAQYIANRDYIPLDVSAEATLIRADDQVYGMTVAYGFGYYVQHSLSVGVSYRMSELGKSDIHAFERGEGWGGSLGYRYYFKAPTHGLFVGARAAVWQMEYEHIDISGLSSFTEFSTVTRLFAYPEVGYRWLLPVGLQLGAAVGYGTDRTLSLEAGDEPVQERWSPTGTVSIGWKF